MLRRTRGAQMWLLSGTMLLDALCVSLLLPVMPALAADLGLGIGQAQWVMSGFAAGFAALLLPGPRLSRRWGVRATYLVALGGFAAAALGAALTEDARVLVGCRAVQGACAALTAPTGLSLIARTWPEGPPRRRAVGVYALVGAAGFSTGLVVSGALAAVGWRWVVAFPAVAALVLAGPAARLLPTATPGGRVADAEPVPVSGQRLGTAVCAAALNGTFLALLLLTAFTLGVERGWSPAAIAAALLCAALPAACSAPVGMRWVGRFGVGPVITVGATAVAGGAVLLVLAPAFALGPTAGALLLVGLGFAAAFPALNIAAVEGVPSGQTGRVVARYQFGVQCGAVLLLALVGHLGTAPAGYGLAAGAGVLAAVTGAGAHRSTFRTTGPAGNDHAGRTAGERPTGRP